MSKTAFGGGLYVLTAVVLLAGLVQIALPPAAAQRFLAFEFRTEHPAVVQVFFDTGHGYSEAESVLQRVDALGAWTALRVPLPPQDVIHLRFDPAVGEGRFGLRHLRVTDSDGIERMPLALDGAVAVKQIQSLQQAGAELAIQTTAGAFDPILEIPLQRPIGTAPDTSAGTSAAALGWFAVALGVALLLALLRAASRWLAPRWPRWIERRHAGRCVLAFAMLGTLLSCAPIVFAGKSFLSPGYGPVLFYNHCPTVPSYTDCETVDTRQSDVGAMFWAFYPGAVAEERSLKQFGEFPLWNRYDSGGITLIGQGQMMLGDPLNWLQWLVGVNAWTMDLKFLLLRLVFAASLGWTVLALTRSWKASAIVAFSAPFIGFFLFRLNHPATFTLCYAPLVLLCWCRLTLQSDARRRLRWLLGALAANWLLINSGTMKEAYMCALELNAIGLAFWFAQTWREPERWRWLALLAAVGALFVLIALPLWATFLAALGAGWTNYDVPAAYQYPPWLLAGVFDAWFSLPYQHTFMPALNFLFALGAVLALLSLRQLEPPQRRAVWILGAAAAVALGIAFGVVPAQWLVQLPFVKNIQFVNMTFSTVALVPLIVLAGIGCAQCDNGIGRSLAVRLAAALVIVLLATAYCLWREGVATPLVPIGAAYAVLALGGAAIALLLLPRWLDGRLGLAGVCTLVLALGAVLGRMAMYPATRFESVLFHPAFRADLNVRPALLDAIAARTAAPPTRVLGLDLALLPGYNQTLGQENIAGPDAVMNRHYHELIAALGVPMQWVWLPRVDAAAYANLHKTFDFLGVGTVLSPTPLDQVPGLQRLAGDSGLNAYASPSAWPRAFFSDRVELLADAAAVAQRVRAGDGTPFVSVDEQALRALPALRTLQGSGAAQIVPARDYRLTNNVTEFTLDAPAAGVAYLGETDYPGDFAVFLDGERVPHVSANSAFKAVPIQRAGTHRLRFEYWPVRFDLYLAVSAAAILGLALLIAGLHRRPGWLGTSAT